MQVSISHGVRDLRPSGEGVGIMACISSRRERCEGPIVRNEGRARRLVSPFTARLRLSDNFPPGAAQALYVHVVLVAGPSWRPSAGDPIPRRGEPGVLEVETVTRRLSCYKYGAPHVPRHRILP